MPRKAARLEDFFAHLESVLKGEVNRAEVVETFPLAALVLVLNAMIILHSSEYVASISDDKTEYTLEGSYARIIDELMLRGAKRNHNDPGPTRITQASSGLSMHRSFGHAGGRTVVLTPPLALRTLLEGYTSATPAVRRYLADSKAAVCLHETSAERMRKQTIAVTVDQLLEESCLDEASVENLRLLARLLEDPTCIKLARFVLYGRSPAEAASVLRLRLEALGQ